MALTKREWLIAVVAALSLALLVADRYVITPVIESDAALEAEQERLVLELEDSVRLFERRKLMARKWEEMTAGGLTSDPADAEGRVLHALRDWAQEARLTLTSVEPERSKQDGMVGEITVRASGTGSMESVARFLWQVETSSLPLRVRGLQLGSRKEGTDDLSLQLKISMLYTSADEAAPPADSGGRS